MVISILETDISFFVNQQLMYWKLTSAVLETKTTTIKNQYIKYSKPIHQILETRIQVLEYDIHSKSMFA